MSECTCCRRSRGVGSAERCPLTGLIISRARTTVYVESECPDNLESSETSMACCSAGV